MSSNIAVDFFFTNCSKCYGQSNGNTASWPTANICAAGNKSSAASSSATGPIWATGSNHGRSPSTTSIGPIGSKRIANQSQPDADRRHRSAFVVSRAPGTIPRWTCTATNQSIVSHTFRGFQCHDIRFCGVADENIVNETSLRPFSVRARARMHV